MKRFITLMLAVLMLFNTAIVFASETEVIVEDAEIIMEEEYYEPEFKYEVISKTVTVDGREYEADLLLYSCIYTDGYTSSELYVQIAPLARAFGYNVSYIEETDSVVFEKDGKKQTLDIQYMELISEDETKYSYIDVISYQDRTYVGYSYVTDIIEGFYKSTGHYGYHEGVDYDYYTADAFIDKYKDSFKGFERIYELFAGKTYTTNSNGTISAEFSIKDLGIIVNGAASFDVSTLSDDGKFRFDVDLDSEGLMNVIDLAMQLTNDAEAQVDFDKSFDFSVLYDGEDMYVKGALGNLVLSEYEYDFDDTEEEVISDVEDMWIKAPSYETAEYPLTTESLIRFIVENCDSYEDTKTALDVVAAVSSYIDMLTVNDENGINFSIKLDKDILGNMLKLAGIEIPEELKGMDVEEFEFVGEELYRNDLSGKSKMSGKLVLNKLIPLNQKTRIGEIKLTIDSSGTTKATDEKVATPEEYFDTENPGEYFE